MARHVALLRGVNVGGRTLSMAALRAALEAAGCAGVVTYIQSGNVVLTPPAPSPRDLRSWLERIVTEVAGDEVPIVLRTGTELERTVAGNPYLAAGATQLHVVFFAEAPGQEVFDGLDIPAFAPEACTLLDRDLYLFLPDGMGRAKLPLAVDKAARAAVPPLVGTARNWNTVHKLVTLAQG